MTIKGAIFDVDGTILDSMAIWDTIAEDYLLSLGYKPKENLNQIFKTISLEQAAGYYQKEYNLKLSEKEIIIGINQLIADFYYNKVQPKKGVKELLSAIKTRNIKMCIATAADKELISIALKRCGLLQYFSSITTCDEVKKNKTKPDIFIKASAKINTKPHNTIVFEDAFHALNTAKNAGFITIGVYDKHEKEISKIIEASDFFIDDYTNLNKFWAFFKALAN